MESSMNRAMQQTSGVGYSQRAGGVPQVAGQTLLGEATTSVNEAVQRAYKLGNIVREFNDGVHGNQPRPESGNSGSLLKAGDATRAMGLRSELSSLHDALAALEHEVQRLNAI